MAASESSFLAPSISMSTKWRPIAHQAKQLPVCSARCPIAARFAATMSRTDWRVGNGTLNADLCLSCRQLNAMSTAICICLLLALSMAASAAPLPAGGSGKKVHYQMDVCGLHKSMNNAPTSTLEFDKVSSLLCQGTCARRYV